MIIKQCVIVPNDRAQRWGRGLVHTTTLRQRQVYYTMSAPEDLVLINYIE